jgi:hypothetical protein
LDNLRRELTEAQGRLEHAQRLQAETAQQLEKSERQRLLAERLREQAVAQAENAKHRLAELESRPMPDGKAGSLIPLSDQNDAYVLMGDMDRQVAEEFIERVDGILLDDAAELSQLNADLGSMSELASVQKTQEGFGRRVRAAHALRDALLGNLWIPPVSTT